MAAATLIVDSNRICALGNRPAGSKWMYTTCFLVFAICQGILLYSVGFTIYHTVPKTSAEWKDFGRLWNNQTLRDLGLSFAATYGLYLVSSIIFLTPWHMLTSFAQYLFLLVRTWLSPPPPPAVF
jgi:chitin synthase